MFEDFCEAQGISPQSIFNDDLHDFDVESKAEAVSDRDIVQNIVNGLLAIIPETDEHGILDILLDPSAIPSNVQYEVDNSQTRVRGITQNNMIKYCVLHAANRPISDFADGNALTWSEMVESFMVTMSCFSSVESVMNRLVLLAARSLLNELTKPTQPSSSSSSGKTKPPSSSSLSVVVPLFARLSMNLATCGGVLEFISSFLSTNILRDMHTINECHLVALAIDKLTFLSTLALVADTNAIVLPPYHHQVMTGLSFPFRKIYAKMKREINDVMVLHLNQLTMQAAGINRVHNYKSLYDSSSSSSSSVGGVVSLNDCGIFVNNTIGIWDGKDNDPSSSGQPPKQEQQIEVFGMSSEMADELLGEDGSRPPISRVPAGVDMTTTPSSNTIFDLDMTEVARQFTLIDHVLFQSLSLYQLRHKGWGSARRFHRADQVRVFIDRFVSLCQWTTHAVLACGSCASAFGICGYAGTPATLFNDDCTIHYSLFIKLVRRLQGNASDCVSRRVAIVSKLVDLASEFDRLNNFHGVMAVISGLKHMSIRSLMNLLPQVKQARFVELNEIMSESRSYANYRDQLNNRLGSLLSVESKRRGSTAVIPHLAVHLADLTFIEDGNPDFLIDLPHLINVYKLRGLTGSIKLLWQMQDKQKMLYNVDQIRFISVMIQRDLKPFQRLKTQLDTDAVSKLLATLAGEMRS